MRVALVYPRLPLQQGLNAKHLRKAFMPPLGLGVLAALTPEYAEVTIVDEQIRDFDHDEDYDLVGITAFTSQASRAYWLADRLRNVGTRVVIGGFHASAMPSEAKKHADAIVIGEAEPVWRGVVKDALLDRLRPVYRGGPANLQQMPLARRDLYEPEHYALKTPIQASRGCPYSCAFCSISAAYGKGYRTRPVVDVIEEIRTSGAKTVVFVDDNLVGDRAHAAELFQALCPLRIEWLGQVPVSLAFDDELLMLAAESGCASVFVGFESLRQTNLVRAGKAHNPIEKYLVAIDRFHTHGIAIEGAFVFGFDDDDDSVFEETVDFTIAASLELALFSILTPFPGTRLYQRLRRANRILSCDWSQYTTTRAVFEPKQMSARELENGLRWTRGRFYSLPSMIRRLRRVPPDLRFWALNLGFNLSNRGVLQRAAGLVPRRCFASRGWMRY